MERYADLLPVGPETPRLTLGEGGTPLVRSRARVPHHSRRIRMKPGTTNAAAAGGNLITGRSAFLSLLRDEGVDRLFGNPGTTELPIMHALGDEPDMGYVLGLQEGIVVAMADGYARASGRLAACNVHVAPGLGNAMGSLYNAKFWGSPVLVTAGQQEIGHGLTEPLLYDPLVPIAEPLVKWAVEVQRLEDLPRIVRRAAKVALTPPTGPVFLSLPGDILNRAAALELDPVRTAAALHVEVRPAPRTVQVGPRHAPAQPSRRIHREPAATLLPVTVDVFTERIARLPARLDERTRDGVRKRGGGDSHRPSVALVGIGVVHPGFEPPEVGQDVGVSPSRRARRTPSLVVERVAAQVYESVDAR